MVPATLAQSLRDSTFRAAVAVILVAGLLTLGTTSLWSNVPLALLAVALARLWLPPPTPPDATAGHRRLRVRIAPETAAAAPGDPDPLPQPTPQPQPRPNRWRSYVRSPVVESAWETLCGAIIQEVRCIWRLCIFLSFGMPCPLKPVFRRSLPRPYISEYSISTYISEYSISTYRLIFLPPVYLRYMVLLFDSGQRVPSRGEESPQPRLWPTV
jgi:hypothetical protein